MKKIIIAVIAVVALIGGSGGLYLYLESSSADPTKSLGAAYWGTLVGCLRLDLSFAPLSSMYALIPVLLDRHAIDSKFQSLSHDTNQSVLRSGQKPRAPTDA